MLFHLEHRKQVCLYGPEGAVGFKLLAQGHTPALALVECRRIDLLALCSLSACCLLCDFSPGIYLFSRILD